MVKYNYLAFQGFVVTGTSSNATITSEACEKGSIEPPEKIPNPTRHWIVLVKKGGCTYKRKVQVAQNAGYDAVIVHNVRSNVLGLSFFLLVQ